jgi:hypothetical protein
MAMYELNEMQWCAKGVSLAEVHLRFRFYEKLVVEDEL